jgi:hypothetical protein
MNNDMAKSYRVFIGSPPPNRRGTAEVTSWKTVSAREVPLPLAPLTLEQAEHRLSLVYENVIFDNARDPEGFSEDGALSVLL